MAVDIARFLSGIQSPVDRLQQGILFGQGQSDRAAAQEANQAKTLKQAQLQKELLDLSQNENRSADDFNDFLIRNPGLQKSFQGQLDQLNLEARNVAISDATNVFAALSSGNTDAALNLLEVRKKAAENSGDKQETQKADILIQTIKANPEAALTSATMFLSAAMGPEAFAKTFNALKGVGQAKPITAQSAIAKLNADLKNKLITKEQHAAAQKKLENLPVGTKLTIDKDGNVSFTQGDVAGDQILPGRSTKSKIEAELLTNRARMDRMNTIVQRFNPTFLQIGTRIGIGFDALKEKLNIGKLTPEESVGVSDMAAFMQDSFNDLNLTLKEMSGAAINPAEAERLLKSMPNPGSSLLDGDSPTQFRTKMVGIIRTLKQAQARLRHALREGLNFDDLSLPAIENIVAERRAELKKSGLSNEEINLKLQEEFG